VWDIDPKELKESSLALWARRRPPGHTGRVPMGVEAPAGDEVEEHLDAAQGVLCTLLLRPLPLPLFLPLPLPLPRPLPLPLPLFLPMFQPLYLPLTQLLILLLLL